MNYFLRCLKLRSSLIPLKHVKILSTIPFKQNSDVTITLKNHKYRKHRAEQSWWFENNYIFSIAAVGGLVQCQPYINNTKQQEKKFFRAVQYGIEQEVKR